MTELRRVTWEKKMKKEEEKMMTNTERWRGKRTQRREGGRAGEVRPLVWPSWTQLTFLHLT